MVNARTTPSFRSVPGRGRGNGQGCLRVYVASSLPVTGYPAARGLDGDLLGLRAVALGGWLCSRTRTGWRRVFLHKLCVPIAERWLSSPRCMRGHVPPELDQAQSARHHVMDRRTIVKSPSRDPREGTRLSVRQSRVDHPESGQAS